MNYEAWLLNKKPPHFPLLFSLWMHKKDSPRIQFYLKTFNQEMVQCPIFRYTILLLSSSEISHYIDALFSFVYSRPINTSGVVAMHTHSSWQQCGLCVSWVTERLSRVSSLLDCSLSLPFLPPPTWGLCNYVYVTTWQWNPNTGNTLHQGIELLLAFLMLIKHPWAKMRNLSKNSHIANPNFY